MLLARADHEAAEDYGSASSMTVVTSYDSAVLTTKPTTLQSWPLNRLRIIAEARHMAGILGLGAQDVALAFRADLRHSPELAADTFGRLASRHIRAGPGAVRAHAIESGVDAVAIGIIGREKSNYPRPLRFYVASTIDLAAIEDVRFERNRSLPAAWRFWERRYHHLLRISRTAGPDLLLGWNGAETDMKAIQDELRWLRTSSPDVSGLDPVEFEQFVVGQLQRIARSVRATVIARGRSGDGGVDAVIYHEGAQILVQCKRYARPVGPEVVRDLIGAVSLERAAFGIIVASSGFSSAASVTARNGRIRLVHAAALNRCTAEQFEIPASP